MVLIIAVFIFCIFHFGIAFGGGGALLWVVCQWLWQGIRTRSLSSNLRQVIFHSVLGYCHQMITCSSHIYFFHFVSITLVLLGGGGAIVWVVCQNFCKASRPNIFCLFCFLFVFSTLVLPLEVVAPSCEFASDFGKASGPEDFRSVSSKLASNNWLGGISCCEVKK